MVYRENTEDIYIGIEWAADDAVGQELLKHLNETVIPASPKLGNKKIREGSGAGIKPVREPPWRNAMCAVPSSTRCACRANSGM